MRVLMFGWEFPPHIAGGLGTACEGIVKGLAYNGVETLFVMPSASGDEDQSATTIINASDVAVDTVSETVEEYLDKVKFIHIGTNMVPYADPEEFSRLVDEDRKRQVKDFSISYGQKYKFSGKYGANLMEEVARYAMVGGTIALQRKDEFDVIHAHDWLTYYAGIAAKELTGKPLVIHVHATSFDRGSVDNIDTRVFAIEKKGMMMADRVVTVSNLTRNIVINRYGIDPGKVVTVHNAVDFSGRENLVVERGVKEKVVTFLGRITYQKGPEYFIEAAAKVLKRTKNVRFVMAGSGDMMNRCIRHAARLGISTASISRASSAGPTCRRCSPSRTCTSCRPSPSRSASRPSRRCGPASRPSSPSSPAPPKSSSTPSRWTSGTWTRWPTRSTPSSTIPPSRTSPPGPVSTK